MEKPLEPGSAESPALELDQFWQFVRKVPFKVLILLVALSLVLRELYPFSHYPLYTNFDGKTWYVYLTDQDDKPLPTVKVARVRTSRVKKVYDSRLRKLQGKKKGKRQPQSAVQSVAAEQTLDFLLALKGLRLPAGLEELRLYRVDLVISNQSILKEKRLLGTRSVSK